MTKIIPQYGPNHGKLELCEAFEKNSLLTLCLFLFGQAFCDAAMYLLLKITALSYLTTKYDSSVSHFFFSSNNNYTM